jgi:hypothetical protein
LGSPRILGLLAIRDAPCAFAFANGKSGNAEQRRQKRRFYS